MPLLYSKIPAYDSGDTEVDGIVKRFFLDGVEVGWEFDDSYLRWAENTIREWHKALKRRGHFITEFADGSSAWSRIEPEDEDVDADNAVYILTQHEDDYRAFRLDRIDRGEMRTIIDAAHMSLGEADEFSKVETLHLGTTDESDRDIFFAGLRRRP